MQRLYSEWTITDLETVGWMRRAGSFGLCGVAALVIFYGLWGIVAGGFNGFSELFSNQVDALDVVVSLVTVLVVGPAFVVIGRRLWRYAQLLRT